MSLAWWLILVGIIFCLTGILFFQRNAFEENKKIIWPVLIMVAGVVLIGIGMAKKLGLME
jgi:di/tricarboxylate transporter